MDSAGQYILSKNPSRIWSRASNNVAPITPLLQFKKKYEVLKQNAFVPALTTKKRAPLTTSVRIGNVVYPVQAELYTAVLTYLHLKPLTFANLELAISAARQQLQLPPSLDVQMSRLPKMLDNHPRRTYLAGGGHWQQQLVPSEYPINFKIDKIELTFPILDQFNQVFTNQIYVGVYNVSYIADDGVTWLSSESELFEQLSGRQIISHADWKRYLLTKTTIYSSSLIIIKPSSIDIYGGVYPTKLGFIFSINNKIHLAVMQGQLQPYAVPYPPTLDIGFVYLADDWVSKKKVINNFLRNYNFDNHVNYKLLQGQGVVPQLA